MSDGEQTDLSETEPEEYRMIGVSSWRTHTLGTTDRIVGFCVNSPGAVGYCDDTTIWVADQLVDPARVIEVSIHECIHGIWPELSEDEVERAAIQIASFVVNVFKVKGDGPLPSIKSLLTNDNVEKLFGVGARLAGTNDPVSK